MTIHKCDRCFVEFEPRGQENTVWLGKASALMCNCCIGVLSAVAFGGVKPESDPAVQREVSRAPRESWLDRLSRSIGLG